jgi:peptidyl-prolyl cis-trans isomerase A (cyclophilin A)
MGTAAVLAAVLAGCGSAPPPKKETAQAPVAADGHAPEVFRVLLDTTKGPVELEVHRAWAPRGADQFHYLVKSGFYDGNRFFRVVRNFVVQFGISGDPSQNRLWGGMNLPDDLVKQSNVKGKLTFATTGQNGRTTQLFINLRDNRSLDKQGFAPIGKVVSGMDTVERLYNTYGEMPSRGGHGPDPTKIAQQGNEYLDANFARLDSIRKAKIE